MRYRFVSFLFAPTSSPPRPAHFSGTRKGTLAGTAFLALASLMTGCEKPPAPQADTFETQTQPPKQNPVQPLSLFPHQQTLKDLATRLNIHPSLPQTTPEALQTAQKEYFQIIDPISRQYLMDLYQAEAQGNVFQGTGNAPDAPLIPGQVYRYFAGHTLDNEQPPDDGAPGTARIAKRFVKEYNGQLVQVDLCEAWQVHWKDGQLKSELEEVRMHFTSGFQQNHRVNLIVFNRFHVGQHEGGPTFFNRLDYDGDNHLIKRPKEFIDNTPSSCQSCHIGLVGFPRTNEVLTNHYPEASKGSLDNMSHPAFHMDTFLPDRVYQFPVEEHLGLKELLAKGVIPQAELPEARQALQNLNAFQPPAALIATLVTPIPQR